MAESTITRRDFVNLAAFGAAAAAMASNVRSPRGSGSGRARARAPAGLAEFRRPSSPPVSAIVASKEVQPMADQLGET